jgi:hypothetical protein
MGSQTKLCGLIMANRANTDGGDLPRAKRSRPFRQAGCSGSDPEQLHIEKVQ